MFDNTESGGFTFDLPKNQSNVIKVIGVGGGGSNAINYMCKQGINGVDFIVCNTDAQALDNSPVPVKIQLGVSLTEGLGAGANPDVGERAAVESSIEIEQMLDTNTKMVFITAGMGGGTGTGAAPVIARLARERDILVVGIVTIPFQFEGKTRMQQALNGVEKLRAEVDSLIVINNNKLREVYGNLGFKAGFSKADEVLATASKGIAEVITHHYTQNIDLKDAKTVLSNSGTAIMGAAIASGSSRAKDAISTALDSPLLNDNKIKGAKNVLLLIVSGTEEITIDEIGEINDFIQSEAGHNANIIMGVGEDESLEDSISVTVIATGFNAEQQHEIVNTEPKKTIYTLENDQVVTQDLMAKEPMETPQSTQKVVFELEEELPVMEQPIATTFENELLIETTEAIANIEVDYTLVTEEEFVITPAQPVVSELEVNEPEFIIKEENQFLFAFDEPIQSVGNVSQSNENELVKTTAAIESIQVNSAISVVPVTEIGNEGVIKYSLEDLEDPQPQFIQQPLAQKDPIQEQKEENKELDFSFKVVEKPVNSFDKPIEEQQLSTEMTIAETLRLRTELRRKKMKEFNYKFTNTGQIDDLEREPAYKRRGTELDESPLESANKKSRISFGEDGFRSNNSFLHDNVD
ncbi:MAG: cell division protein FtsZ [Flavobacteriales bacterium]|nr:cell division protein FtsZ [Flavobacteriales bacterium]